MPVEIEEKEKRNHLDDGEAPCYYNGEWADEQLPGGAHVSYITDSFEIVRQTTCVAVNDEEGNRYMLTAAHLWYDDDAYDEPCTANGNDIVGEYARHKPNEDETSDWVRWLMLRLRQT